MASSGDAIFATARASGSSSRSAPERSSRCQERSGYEDEAARHVTVSSSSSVLVPVFFPRTLQAAARRDVTAVRRVWSTKVRVRILAFHV